MKQFCCGDVVPGCKATFRAAEESMLFTQIADHARRDHGIHEVPVSLLTQIRAHIREVTTAA